MSQIVGMAKRLQEAEATIVELRRALDQMASDPKRPTTSSDSLGGHTSAAQASGSLPGTYIDTSHATYALGRSVAKSRESTTEELLSDLSLDASGKVGHFVTAVDPREAIAHLLSDMLPWSDVCRA